MAAPCLKLEALNAVSDLQSDEVELGFQIYGNGGNNRPWHKKKNGI